MGGLTITCIGKFITSLTELKFENCYVYIININVT